MSKELSSDWERYFQKNKDRDVRPLFLESLKYLNDSLNAKKELDLGCGVGVETFALLKNNFLVDSVDHQLEAKKYIESNLDPIYQSKFSFYLSDFSDFKYTKQYDFVYAYHSLSFCKSEDFLKLTNDAVHCLKMNGVFAGSFFGEQDEWSLNGKVNGITKNDLLKILNSFEILSFKETLQNNAASTNECQKFHVFDVIAQRKNE